MPEYRKTFQEMLKAHRELFENFQDIHDEYVRDPSKWQKLFNQYGQEVVDVIRLYERRLCATSEKGQYGKYSANLSRKFWGEVRNILPKIDFVGVTTD